MVSLPNMHSVVSMTSGAWPQHQRPAPGRAGGGIAITWLQSRSRQSHHWQLGHGTPLAAATPSTGGQGACVCCGNSGTSAVACCRPIRLGSSVQPGSLATGGRKRSSPAIRYLDADGASDGSGVPACHSQQGLLLWLQQQQGQGHTTGSSAHSASALRRCARACSPPTAVHQFEFTAVAQGEVWDAAHRACAQPQATGRALRDGIVATGLSWQLLKADQRGTLWAASCIP